MAASTGGRSWRGGGREGLGGSTLATPLMAVLEQDTLGRIYTGPTAPGPAQPSHIEESKGAEKPLVFLCHINICLCSLLFWVKKSPYTQSRIVHGDSSTEEVLRINETLALCDFMTIG